MANTDPRYNDEQVGLILRRATELAAAPSSESPSASGLTLVDLEQIAIEAGIDPALIRRAAHEIDGARDTGDYAWVLGAPTSVRVHRVVAASVPVDLYDDLLAEIHLAGIGHGTASVVGKTMSWKGMGAGQAPDSVQVTISTRDGRTELHAERKRSAAMGGLLGGLVGGGGIGVGVGVGLPIGITLGSTLATVVIPVAAVGGAYMMARGFFQRGHRKHTADLERLLDTLVSRIETAGGPGPDAKADASPLPPGLPPGPL